ncbi:hypothetical protein ACT3CD_00345 [Geofilum sp. OHC36d9]|uniref:hypothetical protein n=1 Tax=Geofilum sp. OHC36d9 TaxID=3458413 RepID=UPI00403427DA
MDKLIVILSSTWKFAATFPVAVYGFKMSFTQTILYTNIGGVFGIVASGLLSKGLIKLYIAFWPKKLKRKPRKKFTKSNRRLVRLKTKYGLHGIVFLTPVLLSIPVGTFLVTKYYKKTILNYLYLLTAQIIWSVIYTFFYIKIKGIF